MKQLILALTAILIMSGMSKAQTLKTIPNADFDTWDSVSYNNLDSPWVTSNAACLAAIKSPNVTKVAGFSGQAVHLQTYIASGDTFAGEISNFGGFSLGVPYTQSPSAIKGYYRCNMVGNDTAWLVLEFLQAGNILDIDTIFFTGSVNSFKSFTHNISLPGTPDNLIIAAVSSNLISDVDVNAGSWLELDELSFTGTGITQQIADGNFDAWTTNSIDVPAEWQTPPLFNPGDNTGVSRSLDHYSGLYSLKLTEPSNSFSQLLSTGKFDQNGNVSGGLPYQQLNDTLTGYYKYFPSGLDSGGIEVTIQNQGSILLQTGFVLNAASTWTPFEIPISVSSAPDTMRVDLFASVNFSGIGGSVLYLDNLQLKSQPHTSGVHINGQPAIGINAFPNPAQNQLNIRFTGNVPAESSIKIYNSEGRLMIDNQFSSGSSTVTIPISQLSAGLYFYEVTANGSIVRNKFAKN